MNTFIIGGEDAPKCYSCNSDRSFYNFYAFVWLYFRLNSEKFWFNCLENLRGFAKCTVKLSVVTMSGDRHLFWFRQQAHYIFSEFLTKSCSLLFKLILISSLMRQECTIYCTILYFRTFIFFPFVQLLFISYCFTQSFKCFWYTGQVLFRLGTVHIHSSDLSRLMELKKIPVSEVWVW